MQFMYSVDSNGENEKNEGGREKDMVFIQK